MTTPTPQHKANQLTPNPHTTRNGNHRDNRTRPRHRHPRNHPHHPPLLDPLTPMPVAPPRACARCNQPAQRGQPCACRPAYEGSTHPSSNDRRWQRARTNQLRTQPICHCGRLATDVDHIVPLAEGGDRYAWSNLQSLCHTHHVQKTAADAQRGKTRAR